MKILGSPRTPRTGRTIDDIVADLDRLAAADFDDDNPAGDGWARLSGLCGEALAAAGGAACAPAMFRVMERLDESDLGMPGPLVPTLESWRGRYEPLLAESVDRKPSPLTVWMVNRLLNSDPMHPDLWLALLRRAAGHPGASPQTRADARSFLRYQWATGPWDRGRESGVVRPV
jgi:hypothetical protein